ncbi:hypothetical protein K6Y31_04010 [Motilimonas cestriensis]|uniref:VWFA domain-containing protein n=1 Tax=Motilimonas cestriensis TaxID=2742685 RepID=A0ABS8W6Z1_9GAMM|nr:hypothetical protein [Motilimonas cestriensis]MCE2593978.1 hypothetical protein [Motilimonas cestriensis]
MNKTSVTLAILMSLSLSACGGGSSSTADKSTKATPAPTIEPTVAPTIEPTVAPTIEPTVAPTIEPTVTPTAEPTPAPVLTNINGQLVVPVTITASARKTLIPAPIQARSEACPGVPDGYSPLADAVVELKNAAGDNLESSTTTDTCGKFEFVVPKSLVDSISNVVAAKSGFKNIIADVDNFLESNASRIASTISDQASYEITGLKKSSAQSINFIITDSESKKAILGLQNSAFTFSLDGQTITSPTITSSQNTATDSASVAITLDSSGSMGALVYDENNRPVLAPDGNTHRRQTIAASAAHQLIDMTKANDPNSEMAIIMFSSVIYPMTDTTLNSKLKIFDASGDAMLLDTGRTDNFTQDASTLHTLIDIYNEYSAMYGSYSTPVIERHPDRTDNIAKISYYPFGGSTAFLDSIDQAITTLESTNPTKPVIVALTDGADNSSQKTVDEIITRANQYNYPVTVIAAGTGFSSYDIDDMKRISNETGSEYFEVADLSKLGGFLAGISTRVTFNYDANLNTPLISGQVLNVSLSVNGETPVSREITIP